jgi:hypothetical protein
LKSRPLVRAAAEFRKPPTSRAKGAWLQFGPGDVGVHRPRRLGVGRVLEDHAHAVDLEFLDRLLDVVGGRNEPDRAG